MRYFLAQYNRYYAYIMQSDIRVLYAAVFLLQLTITSTWLYFWYIPKRAVVLRLEQQINDELVETYGVHKKRVNELERYIMQLKKKDHMNLQRSVKPDAIVHQLFSVAKECDIEIERCEMSQVKDTDTYMIYQLQLDLVADIPQLISFFDRCAVRAFPVRCIRCDGTYDVQPSTRLVLQWRCIAGKKSPSTLEKS